MEKEFAEGCQHEIHYYQRRAQKQYYDYIIDRLSFDAAKYNINEDTENKKKLGAEISKFTLQFGLQSFLLDNQMSVVLKNHPQYAQMKDEIEKYERALDLRAKAEIQNMYLQQALQDMDFLKKTDLNQAQSEQKLNQ